MSSIYFCIGLQAWLFVFLGTMLYRAINETHQNQFHISWLAVLMAVDLWVLIDLIREALKGL